MVLFTYAMCMSARHRMWLLPSSHPRGPGPEFYHWIDTGSPCGTSSGSRTRVLGPGTAGAAYLVATSMTAEEGTAGASNRRAAEKPFGDCHA